MRQGWKKTEHWVLQGEGFSVEVSHWQPGCGAAAGTDGPKLGLCDDHIWNVYGIVAEGHPAYGLFPADDERRMTDVADTFPLHGGCTFVQMTPRRGRYYLAHVKFGCDYNHYYDSDFRGADTPEAARQVFADAEALFDALAAAGKPPHREKTS